MKKPICRVWTFGSDSNPNVEYETLLYTDGSMSCNCPGWTRRVAADHTRSCKHTRAVDLNRADSICIATHTYEPLNPQLKYAQTQTNEKPRLGQRRFAV